MSFANQVAIVTGGSSGIGWALAKELAAQGAAVGVIARRHDRLEALVKDIEAAGGKAAWATADVTDRAQTVTAIHTLRDRLGPIDLLIANSGIGMVTTINPMNVEDIEAMFRVNVFGVVYAIEAVLPEMLKRGSGHIAAVSSLAAYMAVPGESSYCASKAAVNSFMDGLRMQLKPHKIAVTTICPGFIETPMIVKNKFTMPWLMSADRAAQLIVRALGRKKKVYNFPWQTSFFAKLIGWLPDWMVIRLTRHTNPISS
jgi:short-subunit dehydrogenase